jgi:hypothetical protein
MLLQSRRKGVCVWGRGGGGGNPSLSKKIGDLRIYFSNLHLKIRNIFSKTKNENLLASKSLFLSPL